MVRANGKVEEIRMIDEKIYKPYGFKKASEFKAIVGKKKIPNMG